MADSAAWTLYGIEPKDKTFRDAGEEVNRRYWRWIAGAGCDRFHWRCNQGLGSDGTPLTPISASTAARGRKRSYTGLGNANNPPLVPALGLSRFESLLKGRGYEDHAEWYWTVDPVTGLHWGQMALWHAAGGGGRYPKRNVIGWSPADIAFLRAQGQTWWIHYLHGERIAEAMAALETRSDKLPRVPAAWSPRFKPTGKTDLDHFVFGIGGTEQVVRRSIEEGTFSGFRRLGGGGGPRGGGKAAPKPAPTVPMRPRAAPVPAVRRPAAVAKGAEKPVTIPATAPKRRPGEKVPARPAAKSTWVNPYDAMPRRNPLAHERAPITRPVAAPPIPSTVGPPPDLATFAARVKAAAATVGKEGRFGDVKVFVSYAHSAYVRRHGPIALPTFKQLLGKATQARHLNMSRADMVEAMDELDVIASTMHHPMGMELHFIRTDY